MPPVSRYMSAPPCVVERGASLADARALMRANDIRHLPVVDDGALCGMISDRDVHLFEAIFHSDPFDTRVEEAMSEPPYAVDPTTPLDEVVDLMGERKLGSVVVAGKAGVRGIFTATDACRALAHILRRELG